MADNAQKYPLQASLNRLSFKRTSDSQQVQPKVTPVSVVEVSGALVTVKFEIQSNFTLPNVTVPKAESAYFRAPTQVGDFGYLVPADFYVGGISQQGVGTANAYPRANLTNGVFLPISRKSFATVDPNKAEVVGPNGVILGTLDGSVSLNIDKTGNAILTLPAGKTLIIKTLPTTDPGISGALWNSSQTVKVSP